MNGSVGSKTVQKSSHWSKHGKHGGMRGIAAMLNREIAQRRRPKSDMVDARELHDLWRKR